MIKIFTKKNDFTHYRKNVSTDLSLGLVPTMGNLHKGHLSLMERSIQDNDITIVTIFVNPTQFGPTEDFEKYPRTLDDDLSKISSLALLIDSKKEVVVFAPTKPEEIYPEGFSTSITVGKITHTLEGAIRPTHFDGVSTVVFKLFNLTKAHNAYFGQKDFQQCLVIKKMVLDLDLPINIHVMPIIRNSEGLALSSRNQYLNESERTEALTLPKSLLKIEKLILTNQDYLPLIETLKADKRWDYLSVLDADTLEARGPGSTKLVIIGAFKLGTTRLLDNIEVDLKKDKNSHDG